MLIRALLAGVLAASGNSLCAGALPALRVSDNGRFFVTEHGKPFFWLGDTAWMLFDRLSREEADLYLKDRAAKKFTVIQAAVRFSGGENHYDQRAFVSRNPPLPNEAYFQHVDYIVDKAESLGLYIGLLPVWAGGSVRPKNMLFNLSNVPAARDYGRFLGRRYRDKPIIWILGGDWPAAGVKKIWEAMAKGLAEGDGGRGLITYHPRGGQTSSAWFQDNAWLDFNMIQSGHAFENNNYDMIAADFGRRPIKPIIDGEPGYEDHPSRFDPKYGWLSAPDVRRFAYCAEFAGAAGHTYGCHDIWQFWQPGRRVVTHVRTPWKKALQLPGAAQMQHLRKLIESRPMLIRVPDQSLIVGDAGKTTERVQATRAADGSYAFVYSASGKPVTVRMIELSGRTITAYWFDPRRGTARKIGNFPRTNTRQFTPPSSGRGNDWVLILDDTEKKFPNTY